MRSIAILLFDDVEVLDACGPFEVFSVANRVAQRAGSADHPTWSRRSDRPQLRAAGHG